MMAWISLSPQTTILITTFFIFNPIAPRFSKFRCNFAFFHTCFALHASFPSAPHSETLNQSSKQIEMFALIAPFNMHNRVCVWCVQTPAIFFYYYSFSLSPISHAAREILSHIAELQRLNDRKKRSIVLPMEATTQNPPDCKLNRSCKLREKMEIINNSARPNCIVW